MSLSIYLYAEPSASTLDLADEAAYITELIPGANVQLRPSFIHHHLDRLPRSSREASTSSLAEQFAALRVRNLTQRILATSPLYGEIQYEKRRLEGSTGHSFGVMYEGFHVMKLLQDLIDPRERALKHVHIAFTNQIPGTWEDDDKRFHARSIICGVPSLVSTTGLVEAPAKPRDYYLLKHQYLSLGMYDAAPAELDRRFKGRFIDHDDPRMTDVVKGYVMQAIFFHLFGEAFCDSTECRLYNAHWQEELIHAQLELKNEFCPRHAGRLDQQRRIARKLGSSGAMGGSKRPKRVGKV